MSGTGSHGSPGKRECKGTRLTEWKHPDLNYKIVARIDPSRCIGCDLCSLVCPVESRISMVQVETGKPKESWEQRSCGCEYARPGQE